MKTSWTRFIIPALLPVLAVPWSIRGTPGMNRLKVLDRLAENVATPDYEIPTGARFILLAAYSGWLGPINEVRMLPSDELDAYLAELETDGKTAFFGLAGIPGTGDVLVISAPRPACLPAEVPRRTNPGETATLRLEGFDELSDPAVAVATPEMEVFRLQPREDGSLSFETREIGVYWVEVMQASPSGPSVELLFPVVCGGDILDAIYGDMRVPCSSASCIGEILKELNDLRLSMHMEPLARDPALDETASTKAAETACTDDFRIDIRKPEKPLPPGTGTFAENTGTGKGFQEAWSMIILSPFHLETCLSPEFNRIGMGAAVENDDYRWRLVLVQILAGGSAN